MNTTTIRPWEICVQGELNEFTESLFSIGNGELGVRGFSLQEPKSEPYDHAVFKAGLFEYVKPGITDMVQLPDVLGFRLAGQRQNEVCQTLDMQRGVLRHSWRTQQVDVCTERMVSMADHQLICIRHTISALEAVELAIDARMDPQVCNLPVHDDQMIQGNEMVRLLRVTSENDRELCMQTIHGGQHIRFLCEVRSERPLPLQLKKGEKATLEKRVRVLMENERANAETDDPWAQSEQAWAALWRDCDILVDADERIQGALRYNLFQLLCNNAADNPEVSIGARGLTHGRYKGNTFWDTDVFLLPFYLWHRPNAARNLVRFRLNRLDKARCLAKAQGLDGARYPWMCSPDGLEQCESWDIGLCETHVTADVAYALQRYQEVTGDSASAISELYLETARYWRSRLQWEEAAGQYSSFFVKGPDEYCGAAINNTYTNYMARHNVRLALKYANIDEPERESLSHFQEHIAILYDERRRLFLQDEAFERLEPLPPIPRDGEPLYKHICFDRMQRYRALKQADLVQLMVLFPDAFTVEQMRAVWDAYEPLTVHDSSLSYGVHAHLAFLLGLEQEAWSYFERSLLLDLDDSLHNTGKEGVHMAALGASWQALVYGALGLWSKGGEVSVSPKLPSAIRSISLCVYHRGRRWRITASNEQVSVEKEE